MSTTTSEKKDEFMTRVLYSAHMIQGTNYNYISGAAFGSRQMLKCLTFYLWESPAVEDQNSTRHFPLEAPRLLGTAAEVLAAY